MITKQGKPFVIAIGLASDQRAQLLEFVQALDGQDNAALVVMTVAGSVVGPGVPDNDLAAQCAAFAPVAICQSGQDLTAGHVYLVEPDTVIECHHGRLRSKPVTRRHSPATRLDHFFQAIGECYGEDCAAILAPDDAGSGVLGLEAVSAGGGVAMAFQIDNAAGATTGAPVPAEPVADVFGSPRDLAAGLRSHLSSWALQSVRANEIGVQEIREVCTRVLEITGHDFRHYKQSTLSRRIMRRINVTGCGSFDAYLDHLNEHDDEARTLLGDLLVGVTSFFRDEQAFAVLAHNVIDKLIGVAGHEPVRIWVAGCGRGQEAYSIAMLASEALARCRSTRSVRIFATDLDERALSVARRGLYPAEALEQVSPERRAKFFEQTGRRWKVKRELREMVVFSPHNLITDPPFSRMDLISCRNVLIYLGPHLQKKLHSVFHYALNPQGYLFLGLSEAVSGYEDLFRVINARYQIAQRRPTGIRGSGGFPTGRNAGATSWQPANGEASADLGAIAQRIVLDEFSPPFAIVNEAAQVVYLSGGAADFLEPIEGRYVNNFLRMVRSSLRVGLRRTWNRALKHRRTATSQGLAVEAGDERRRVRFVVQPMPDLGSDVATFMVVYHDLGIDLRKDEQPGEMPTVSEHVVDQLEEELTRTRHDLERVVQDLEAANEELKSSNEELISTIEELRSANDELALSRGEIQASSFALADANADLVNLLGSTQIATIFLDREGKIRNLTPLVSELYNVDIRDLGRPLSHFTPCDPNLPPISGDDLTAAAGEPQKTEVTLADGRTLLRRINLYRNSEGANDGVVVTFVDISDQKSLRDELSVALAELEAIYQQVPLGLAQLDSSLRYLRINEESAAINGVPADQHPGHTVAEIRPDLADTAKEVMKQVHRDRTAVGPFEVIGVSARDPGARRTWLQTWAPVFDAHREILSVQVTSLDITDRKRAEESLERSRDDLLKMTERAPVMLARLDTELVFLSVNPAFEELMQADSASVIGRHARDVLPGPIFAQIEPAMALVIQGEFAQLEFEYLRPSGASRLLQVSFAPEIDGNQRVLGGALAIIDVTEHHAGWRMLARNEGRLRRILDNVVAFVGTLNTEGVLTEANEPAILAAGLRREDVVGKPFWECFWWSYSPSAQERLRQAVAQALSGQTVRYDTEIRIAGDRRLMIDFQLSPVLDDDGSVIELIPSGVDISRRHAAQADLAASLQRLSQMMSAAQVGIAFGNSSGTITQANEAMLRLLQRGREDLEQGNISWHAHSLEKDYPANLAAFELLERSGRIEPIEKLLLRTDGSVVPVLVSAALTDSSTSEHVAFVVDMRAQRQAEAQARADRLALQKVYNTAPVGLAYFDSAMRYRFINDKLALINKTPAADHIGRTSREIRPGLADTIEENMQRAASSGKPLLGVEIHEPGDGGDGSEHWWLVNWIPDLDETGVFAGMHVSVQEITELKSAEAHRELLLAELNHRVKNSLATIQAIASNTLRDSTDPTVFRDAFMGRLRAIASAHDILISSASGRVDVAELVASQVGLFASLDGDQISLRGPAVELAAPVAHALVLVLHELSTNALKYGALSVDAGKVDIKWVLSERVGPRRIRIHWQESGGPTVAPPTRKGFGSRLIETSVSYSLGGETDVAYKPEGVCAVIQIPVEADYE